MKIKMVEKKGMRGGDNKIEKWKIDLDEKEKFDVEGNVENEKKRIERLKNEKIKMEREEVDIEMMNKMKEYNKNKIRKDLMLDEIGGEIGELLREKKKN